MGLSTNLISGLSSGFDWRSMIDQLISIERRPVTLMETRKTEYESKLSEWQSFNSTLLSLKSAAEGSEGRRRLPGLFVQTVHGQRHPEGR